MIKLLLPVFFLSLTAHAAAPTALITKINQSGHVLQEYRFSETCEVYQRRVVVTTTMGGGENAKPVKMKRVYPVLLSPSVLQMIESASKEDFQVSNIQICDAPTTTITAAAPGIKSFPLFESGSCPNPRGERIGGNSTHLRYIVDSFCPKTNDPGAGTEVSTQQ